MFRTQLIATLVATLVFVPVALADEVPNSELFIPYDLIPLEELGWIQIDADQPLVFDIPGDPVIAVRVGEPGLSAAEQPLVCGIDYAADLTAGVATVYFHRSLPFYLEVDLQSGVQLAGHVMVDSLPLAPPLCGAGRQYPVTTPVGHVVLVGSPVMDRACRVPEWEGKKQSTTTSSEAEQAIDDAFAANGNQPVDVTIVAHGSPGKIALGGSSGAGISGTNVAAFAAGIRSKVVGKKIVIVACSVGSGTRGQQFVCDLAEGCGAKVSSATTGVSLCGNGTIKISCGPLFEKDGRPGPIIEDPVTENTIISDPGVGHVFPLDAHTHPHSPLERLFEAWGTADARWDIDRNGVVGTFDAIAVANAFGA